MDKLFADGRLTRDAELRETKTGKIVVKFAIACPRGKDKVKYYNCDFWGERAEKLMPYLKKGTIVSLVGQLDDFTTSEGKTYSTLTVESFGFGITNKSDSNDDYDHEEVQKYRSGQKRDPSWDDDEIPFPSSEEANRDVHNINSYTNEDDVIPF